MTRLKPISDLLAIWMAVCLGLSTVCFYSFGDRDGDAIERMILVMEQYEMEDWVNYIFLPGNMGGVETLIVNEIHSILGVYSGWVYVDAMYSTCLLGEILFLCPGRQPFHGVGKTMAGDAGLVHGRHGYIGRPQTQISKRQWPAPLGWSWDQPLLLSNKA